MNAVIKSTLQFIAIGAIALAAAAAATNLGNAGRSQAQLDADTMAFQQGI